MVSVTRSFPNGGKVTSFSVATSDNWTDKTTGQKQERTTWHSINVMNDALAEIAGKYLKKGSKVYLEGQVEARKYTDKQGVEREVREVVLRAFNAALVLLDPKPADCPDTRPGMGYIRQSRAALMRDRQFLNALHRRLETPGPTHVKPSEFKRLFALASRGVVARNMVFIPRAGLPDAVLDALVEGQPPQRRLRRRKPIGTEP